MEKQNISKNTYGKKYFFSACYFQKQVPEKFPENILLQGVRNTNIHIYGYCLDSGSSITVVVEKQFYAYRTNIHATKKTNPTHIPR